MASVVTLYLLVAIVTKGDEDNWLATHPLAPSENDFEGNRPQKRVQTRPDACSGRGWVCRVQTSHGDVSNRWWGDDGTVQRTWRVTVRCCRGLW